MKITSKNNALVKKFRSFKNGSVSKDKDTFCIEGTHLMEEFLNSGNNPLKIMATEKWLLKNKDLINRIDQSAVVIVPDKVLASAVTTKNPDGVAALVEIASIPNPLLNDDDDLILVLDRIQDPGNMGNLFRTALATGVNQIILAGGAHPLSQKVLRSSCGAVFHLPFQRFDGSEQEIINSLLKCLSELSNSRFKIFSTSSHIYNSKKSSRPYWDIDWTKRIVLILGNEGQGVHKKILEAFNETISIPHSQLVESLNVACVAVPLLLERKRVAYNSNT